jgi:hypothetical protein
MGNRGRMILDNYIIRIYRRDKSNHRFIVGTVEEIGSGEKKGFTTFDELREILVPVRGGRSARMKSLGNRRESARKGM